MTNEVPERGGGASLSVWLDATREVRRRDMVYLGHQLRRRWPLSKQVREAATRRLEQIVADPDQRSRVHLSAIRALAELERYPAELINGQ